jgi:hypothetical protein
MGASRANSSQNPILKIPLTKKGLVEVAQSVGSKFKPKYSKKNLKKKKKRRNH